MFKLLSIIFLLGLSSCSTNNPICLNKSIVGEINSVQLHLEVACSDKDKEQGLMHRTVLEKNSGMIFVYDKENYYAFWMKNTNIPLSIAFLDKNQKIVDIQHMIAHDLTPVATKVKALYAIEMNLNWFHRNNITVGSQFKY